MKRRGKRVALLAAGPCIVVLVATAVALKPWIMEEYYIFRLGADREQTRMAAANALSKMRSVRAVPHLISLLETERRSVDFGWHVPGVLRTSIHLSPLEGAIYLIGPRALPGLREGQRLNPAVAPRIDDVVEAIEARRDMWATLLRPREGIVEEATKVLAGQEASPILRERMPPFKNLTREQWMSVCREILEALPK
jgi:hypothetical protein